MVVCGNRRREIEKEGEEKKNYYAFQYRREKNKKNGKNKEKIKKHILKIIHNLIRIFYLIF